MTYKKEKKIYERVKRIITSDLTWEDKYNMIFSKEISWRFSFKYHYPNTSYEENVMAFKYALDVHMEKQDMIAKQIDY